MSQLKKRSTYLGVLAALVGGMAFAPAASAHTISKADAESSARWVAKQKVNDPSTPYTYSAAVCDPDSRQQPFHMRACTLKYDTPQTRSTSQWACTERIHIYYKEHNAGAAPNYTRYWRNRYANGSYFTPPAGSARRRPRARRPSAPKWVVASAPIGL